MSNLDIIIPFVREWLGSESKEAYPSNIVSKWYRVASKPGLFEYK